jgi:geranylgeranyl transferase type-1 subunit beta
MMSCEPHVKYFLKFLDGLPFQYVSMDTSRMTGLYFSIIALDTLNALDTIEIEKIKNFVYSLQITGEDEVLPSSRAGFVGSNYLGHNIKHKSPHHCDEAPSCDFFSQQGYCMRCRIDTIQSIEYIQGHLAMTYTALAILLTIGDDLCGVNSASIIQG